MRKITPKQKIRLMKQSQQKYKKTGKTSLFFHENTSSTLSKLGNPLEDLHKLIDFEMFRSDLESALLNTNKKSTAGCLPFDLILLFKIILLKHFYNLSDDQVEYQINDRISWRDFLGLGTGDKVPDARTIWVFQDKLFKLDLAKYLFDMFYSHLKSLGIILNNGKIVDASFAEVPRQRNSREENLAIKSGDGDALWNADKNKKVHKDIDARWTRKGSSRYYGYKNHIKADAGSKIIENYEITDASVHDSKVLEKLLDEKDFGQSVYGDSAYSGENIENMLVSMGFVPQIMDRNFRNKPLTLEQKSSNHEKSRVRCRVEHIFGFVRNSMSGFRMRCVGMRRARNVLGLKNLLYNMFRYVQIAGFSSG